MTPQYGRGSKDDVKEKGNSLTLIILNNIKKIIFRLCVANKLCVESSDDMIHNVTLFLKYVAKLRVS